MRLTSTTAPGTLKACFQQPTRVTTAIVCHHSAGLDDMYARISADSSWRSVVEVGMLFNCVLRLVSRETQSQATIKPTHIGRLLSSHSAIPAVTTNDPARIPTVQPNSLMTSPVLVPLPKLSRCLSQPRLEAISALPRFDRDDRFLRMSSFDSEWAERAGVGKLAKAE